MGISGVSPISLLLILGILILLFGTKRLRSLGSDLGTAIKGFKQGMQEKNIDDKKIDKEEISGEKDSEVIK